MLTLDYPTLQATFGGVEVLYQQANPYARHKNSIELVGKDRVTQNEAGNGLTLREDGTPVDALPDVFRYRPASTAQKEDFVLMTERTQHWIFRLCVEVYFGIKFPSDNAYHNFHAVELAKHKKDKSSTFIQWFGQLFSGDRFITNRFGMETWRNYIAQENMDSGDNPKMFHIITGDAVARLANKPEATFGGIKHTALDCINMSGDFEAYHPFDHPHLFYTPTVSGRTMVYEKGGWIAKGYWMRKFHQFNQRAVIPFALPYDDTMYIPTQELVIPSDREPLA